MLTAVESEDDPSAFGRIDWGARPAAVAAVSGGSDSTALTILAHRWLKDHAPGTRLVAVTVDHGLRPGSAAEAETVARLCARLGIEHRTIRWLGPKPKSALSEQAREARYRLLAETAGAAGTDLILVGHTADDQAETVLMRQERGGGPGLAGMARATLLNGKLWILRPLLSCRRAGLRVRLAAEGIAWIEDPSNEDPAFERVRARRTLDERLTLSLLETAGREAKRRMALAAAAAARIRSGARLVAPGLVLVDPVLVHDGGEEAITALRVLLACGGGRTRLPGIRETRQWQERLRGGASALARTIAIPRRKGTYLGREMRNLPQRDRDGVFDGRYRIEAEALRAGWRLVRREARDARAAGRPEAMAMACEPRLWHSGVDGSAGGAPVPAIARHLAPFERFLPGFDLELASAAAALFGRKPFPGPPLAEDGCAVF